MLLILLIEIVFLFAVQVCLSNPVLFYIFGSFHSCDSLHPALYGCVNDHIAQDSL